MFTERNFLIYNMLPDLTPKVVSQGFPMENQTNMVNEPTIYYQMYCTDIKQC